MDNINKAAVAGIIFFLVILAGFVGIKVDQMTIAVLGGAFIGIVVAGVTTALIIMIGISRKDEPPPPPAPRPSQPVQQITHNHYHDHKYVVVVNVPAGADNVLRRWTVAREMRVAPSEAQRMIDAGDVKCLPAGK